MARFEGKRIVVTGGGSGIGRASALGFAREGGFVVVGDRELERAERVAAEIVEAGGEAVALGVDVSRSDDVSRLIEASGPVDVLVNNAGGGPSNGLLEISEEDWDRELAWNLKSAFLCSKAVLPEMIERKRGVIVNVSSVNALAFLANEAYSAAKAGLLSLTRSIAVKYGEHGVRANTVCPGTVRTPAWQPRVDKVPDIFEKLARWYPLGRVGEPEDIANAILFLSSEDAAFITGIELRVDGGALAGSAQFARELTAELGD